MLAILASDHAAMRDTLMAVRELYRVETLPSALESNASPPSGHIHRTLLSAVLLGDVLCLRQPLLPPSWFAVIVRRKWLLVSLMPFWTLVLAWSILDERARISITGRGHWQVRNQN